MNNMNPAVLSDQTSIFITFLSSILIWLMLASLVFMWVVDGRVKREQALHALVATLFAWSLTLMLKTLIPVPRPYVLSGELPLTITMPNHNSSFPSSHSAVAFALATSIWIHNKKLGIRFIILAFLVGMGRILSNVHYLADVWVGATIGMLTAFVTKRLHVFRLLK